MNVPAPYLEVTLGFRNTPPVQGCGIHVTFDPGSSRGTFLALRGHQISYATGASLGISTAHDPADPGAGIDISIITGWDRWPLMVGWQSITWDIDTGYSYVDVEPQPLTTDVLHFDWTDNTGTHYTYLGNFNVWRKVT